ncbi:MAG: 3-isopropylmalate dehydrogenase, partial [Spirochaetota bacterium]|nr:3-isopropylmalate dehydrogenase [Spirochaetota bacterium]
MDNRKNSGKPDKLQWHLAFYDAIRLELFENLDDIEIIYEHQLTSEPMRIDLLIVKKRKDVIINKNIARIFRGHNIIEYKSPDDYFSARDFQQVLAYANHYAANTPGVDDADLSLTFVGNRHPRTLLQYLTE